MPDAQIAIVRYPQHTTDAIIVRFEAVELEAAICSRRVFAARGGLSHKLWSAPGVYVLIGPLSGQNEGLVQARAGYAPKRGLLDRIDDHESGADAIDWWTTVAMFRRTEPAFDSAEAGFLEGELHALLDIAVHVDRIGARDTDETIAAHRQKDLRARILPAIHVGLRLAQLPIDTAQQLEAEAKLEPRRREDEQKTDG